MLYSTTANNMSSNICTWATVMPRLEKNKKTLLPRPSPPAKKKKKKKEKTEKNYISKNETFWPPKEN